MLGLWLVRRWDRVKGASVRVTVSPAMEIVAWAILFQMRLCFPLSNIDFFLFSNKKSDGISGENGQKGLI